MKKLNGGDKMPDTFFSQNEYTFVWDEDKEAINIKKHGIAFKAAARVFEDELRIEFEDPAHSQERGTVYNDRIGAHSNNCGLL